MGIETRLPTYRQTLDDVVIRSGLTDTQTVVYAAIFYAAEMGLPCPKGEELNDLLGYTSDGASRFTVARLEAMGLLKVKRYQRFREVYVVALGKWTARDPSQHSDRVHVPRRKVGNTPITEDRGTYRIDTRKQ